MASQPPHGVKPSDEVPFAQRLFDNWVLLMIAGIVIMAVIYTGWGLYEVFTMPQAQLP